MSIKGMLLFQHEIIDERVVRIFDASNTAMYLVIGDEKAALLDTGYGCGDLKKYAEQFTDRPVIALMTHGHRDHAMGAGQFKSWMSPFDFEKYCLDCTLEMRKKGMEAALGKYDNGLYQNAEEQDWMPALPVEKFHPISPGTIFDLGKITIEAYCGKGHSEGSMMFLIPESRMFLLGDACGWETRIFCSVREYLENLEQVDAATEGRYDRALSSHDGGDLPDGIIKGAIKTCRDVLAGKDEKIPFIHPNKELFGGKNMYYAREIYRENGRIWRRDGGVGGIVYNADLI